jgi:hypothetical protein
MSVRPQSLERNLSDHLGLAEFAVLQTEQAELRHCYYVGANYARYFELPGYGRYFCEVSGFRLLFPNGTVTTEIDDDGIRRKLLDLASYVRAEEDRKRQKIVSDGRVLDDVVGATHEIQE